MRSPSPSYTTVSHSLPILRGWAIVWIVMYHLLGNTSTLSKTPTSLLQGDLKHILESGLKLFLSAGDTGVSIFLVISGFGLTASWLKRYGYQELIEIPLGEYWNKRVFRIFPLFWVAILLSVILYVCNPAWVPFGKGVWDQQLIDILGAFLATITTLRNIIPNSDYYYFLNGAWWYIGLALQLYLVFPVLMRLGQRWGWAKLLLSSLLLSLGYRAILSLVLLDDFGKIIVFDFFPARLFEFTFGIYIAATLLERYCDSPQKPTSDYRWLCAFLFKPQLLIVNVCCFIFGIVCKWSGNELLSVLDNPLVAVGLFGSLVYLARFKLLTIGSLAKIIGKYSYGIYLTHMNIYFVLWPLASQLIPFYWLRFLLVTLICCAIGAGFELGYGRLQNYFRSLRVA
ncbi:MAG: acyltransferase [Cyanobacteria bacterium P01_D01_bin.156]